VQLISKSTMTTAHALKKPHSSEPKNADESNEGIIHCTKREIDIKHHTRTQFSH
jgi:hypothetical protein